jgi:signal transduction histidine kinase
MTFFSILSNIKNIKFSRLQVKSGDEYDGKQKQNIALSHLSVLVIVIGLIHLIDDSIKIKGGGENFIWLSLVEISMIFVSIITYLLNENGKHNIAKHVFLFSFNILLFLLNTVAPKESGSYFFFFPLMAATFIFYGYSDERKRYFYLGLTATIFILLTVFDNNIFGIMVEMDVEYDFFTNLLSSLILMVMTIGFLITLNKRTEGHLLDNQAAMKTLMDDVHEQNVNLEKVNTELDRFVYSVSHDLRAPLMSILGLINLSENEQSADERKDYLFKMRDMVNKLDDFIHEVIDYTRNIKANVEHKEIDVELLIHEIIADLRFMQGWDEIDFQVDVQLDDKFYTDSARLSTIFKNLITNSIKYYNAWEPKSFIKIVVMSSAGEKKIIVSDNGQGIDPKYQQQVLEMFFRGTERSTGSGLGLYIVNEMVNKLAGTLKLVSTLDQGTKITIDF